MNAESRAFETYESVAEYLLSQFAEHFGLQRVEGKQVLQGKCSGTTWIRHSASREAKSPDFLGDSWGGLLVDLGRNVQELEQRTLEL